jgi:hypothetical protein
MMLAVVVRVVVAYSCAQWSMVSGIKTGFVKHTQKKKQSWNVP